MKRIAIAIPTFLGARRRAHEAQIKTAMRDAGTAVETWASDQGGDYSGLDTSSNSDYDYKLLEKGYASIDDRPAASDTR